MKRKMTALLTVVLMLAMLAGCGDSSGSGKSKDMIPLSEVIFSDDDVLVYYVLGGTDSTGAPKSYTEIGKEQHVWWAYHLTPEGNVRMWKDEPMILDEVAQMSDEEIISLGETPDGWQESTPWSLDIITDGSGNNTSRINFNSSRGFGKFLGHITIYDISFMVFQSYCDGSVDNKRFYLIRDTKDTIDKTVYLDEPGTEGFTTDGQ